MVSISQVKQGVSEYITNEIIAKMTGWQKWVAGAFASMAIVRSDQLFDSLKENSIVSMLGVISDDGMIDIDAIHEAFAHEADVAGPIQINIPGIGSIKLSRADVDMLHRYIKQGG